MTETTAASSTPPSFSVDLVGLRDIQGRFGRLADGELQLRAAEGAEELSRLLAEIYRKQAPKGETGDFRNSFGATVVPGDGTITIEVQSSKPDLRRWLKYGTGVYATPDDTGHSAVGQGDGGAIVPTKGARALYWQGEPNGENWFASVLGIRPNKWEDAATAEAKELAKTEGQKFTVKAITE